ncbi:hypothetical protein ABIB68_000007 [Bradyrhizobium sp. F1.2.2]
MILIQIRDLHKPDWLASGRPFKAFRVQICDDILERGDGLLYCCNLLQSSSLIGPMRLCSATTISRRRSLS